MGLIKKIDENAQKATTVVSSSPESASYERPRHYEDDSIELDAIERLKANILMLDDLQKRLGFMNSEIENIIGSRKK